MTRISVDPSKIRLIADPSIDEYWRNLSRRAETMGLICIERDCRRPALFMEMGDSAFYFCLEHAKHVLTHGNRDIEFKPEYKSSGVDSGVNMDYKYILFQIGDSEIKPISTVAELEASKVGKK